MKFIQCQASSRVVRTSFLLRALLDVRPRMRRLLQVLQIECIHACIDSSKKFLSESEVFNVNKGPHVSKEATR